MWVSSILKNQPNCEGSQTKKQDHNFTKKFHTIMVILAIYATDLLPVNLFVNFCESANKDIYFPNSKQTH